eukprot:Plantae.Rhodophyta-Palmaria_palmata.ctg5417.p2 GENE.Plantae.Rhodophyta-Palmaria_palmata.ctg5417~~Plantae.Rhodophyta-Palmaria_palmata.ctg5417.p2  ORF type:complete len:102 (-),score=7.02 Plantae.Rhodophyta-Palmaria_palmata.ctg5417:66-371(-)
MHGTGSDGALEVVVSAHSACGLRLLRNSFLCSCFRDFSRVQQGCFWRFTCETHGSTKYFLLEYAALRFKLFGSMSEVVLVFVALALKPVTTSGIWKSTGGT